MSYECFTWGKARAISDTHPSRWFYLIGIGFSQTPISCHSRICGGTSFPEKLKPLRVEAAEI
jgi:hypothetical protein